MDLIAKFKKSSSGDWDEQKDKLKKAFPKLTFDDLNFDSDHKTEMLRHLEFKLALTAQELRAILR